MRTPISASKLGWAGLFFTVLGAKLLLIDRFGSNVPFWDQWDSEALYLYAPYLNGTLRFGDLFAPHNEHRILVTRVFNLALLELNGLWFPRLQMVANAVLHVSILAWMTLVLGRGLPAMTRLILASFVALAFSIPFGWENTLAGFQSSFYFVFGFSFLAIVLMVPERAFSARWVLGVVALLLACVSMSSGVLAISAIVAVNLLQMIVGDRRHSIVEAVGVLALCLAFLLIYQTIPVVEHHNALKAASVAAFIEAFFTVAAWPSPFGLPAAILLNLPSATLLFVTLSKRQSTTRLTWLLLGTMAWVATQWVSFAYGRAAGATAPRYTDTLMVGVVVNVAVALYLASLVKRRTWLAGLYCVSVIIVMATAGSGAFGQAASRGTDSSIQLGNLRSFYATGDIEALRALPFFAIPYPDADRLAMIATNPTVKSVLHPEVTGQPASADLALPGPVTWVVRGAQLLLLRGGWLILLAGVTLMIVALARLVMTAIQQKRVASL